MLLFITRWTPVPEGSPGSQPASFTPASSITAALQQRYKRRYSVTSRVTALQAPLQHYSSVTADACKQQRFWILDVILLETDPVAEQRSA